MPFRLMICLFGMVLLGHWGRWAAADVVVSDHGSAGGGAAEDLHLDADGEAGGDVYLDAAFETWFERISTESAAPRIQPASHAQYGAAESWESFPLEPGEILCPDGICPDQVYPALPMAAPRESGFFARGWISQGFTWNPDNPADEFNGPLEFNDRANEFLLNQVYLSMGRAVNTCHWDIGGRVDLMYGSDYFFVQAAGLETNEDGSPHWNSDDGPRGAGAAIYGMALPQAYAEAYVPIGGGLAVKMGHFYTNMGYESVMDPVNFFYSRSYAMSYGEPLTHTGVLTTYQLAPLVEIHSGFTRGWDNWEDLNGKPGYMAGVHWRHPHDLTSFGFSIHSGKEDPEGENNRFLYSFVFMHKLTPTTTYVLQHDFGSEPGLVNRGQDELGTAKWYGLSQYLFYNVCKTTDLGLRVEWFRDQDNARVLQIPNPALVDGGNFLAVSAGLNWSPCKAFTLRSEVRYDWSDVKAPVLGAAGVFDSFTKDEQFTVGINLIVPR